jgi:hypothetical protein
VKRRPVVSWPARLGALVAALAPLVVALPMSSCEVDLGTLPAKCSDGKCPEGYDCIHGVCALPGTPIPTTVQTISYLRGVDLRLVPQSGSVLVAWETYAYSTELQGFVARRVFADGTTSPILELDRTLQADEGGLEPYFDVFATSDTHLVLAVTAGPVDDDPRPRIAIYSVTLPEQGNEASGAESTLVGPELRVSTIGYGAVSRPRLVQVGADALELGYVVSRSLDMETSAALGVLPLSASGEVSGTVPTCISGDEPDTCPAVRTGDLPVAVGVVDAFRVADTVYWTLDDARPSVLVASSPDPTELRLPPLAVPLRGDAEGVVYLAPSKRAGEQLPSDPVEGAASLGRVDTTTPTQDETLHNLPGIRDTPRPAWVERSDRPSLLVTPGTDIASPTLTVMTVDLGTGTTTTVATVERFSSLELAALQAAVVDGKLYVVWLETSDDQAVIRAAVLPEP